MIAISRYTHVYDGENGDRQENELEHVAFFWVLVDSTFDVKNVNDANGMIIGFN